MKKMMLLSSVLSIFFLANASFDQEKCEVPVWHEGYSWTYESSDSGKKYNVEVVDITDEGFIVDTGGVLSIYDRKTLNYKGPVKKEGYISGPAAKLLNFPLYVGKKWSDSTDYTIKGKKTTWLVDFTVEGTEQVKTPAGTFKAFRIVANVSKPGSPALVSKVWYSPDVKFWIKKEYVRDKTHVDILSGYKLTEKKTEPKEQMAEKKTEAARDIEAKDVRLANIRLLIPRATLGRWSPDGKKIMYTLYVKKEHGDVPQIRITSLDGKSQQIIAEGSMPSWSPTGTMICYIGPEWKDGYYVYRFSDGKKAKIYDRDVAGTAPIWSKDGKGIAFIPTAGGAEYIDLETLRASNFEERMRGMLCYPGFDASPNFYIWNVGGDLLKLGNIAVISKRDGTQYPLLQMVCRLWQVKRGRDSDRRRNQNRQANC
jgi:hypothetical protein